MRTLAYIVVLLIAVVAIVSIVGWSLPVAHVSSRGERFDAPPPAVWKVVTEVGAYASWRSDISAVELLPPVDGRPAWREISGGDRVEYVADAMVEPTQFVSRITTKGLPYGGRWRYELTPDAGGTRVTITEEGEVYNPIFRFMMKYVLGETATIEKVLTALAKRLAR